MLILGLAAVQHPCAIYLNNLPHPFQSWLLGDVWMPVRTLQVAMDFGQILFDYNLDHEEYQMKLLDRALHDENMRQAAERMEFDFEVPDNLAALTWGELDGRAVKLLHDPATRCMLLKARVALMKAEDERWVVPGTVKLTDHASEGDYKEIFDAFTTLPAYEFSDDEWSNEDSI